MQLLQYTKLIFYFLFNMVKYNLAKSIMIIFSIVSYNQAGKITDIVKEYSVIEEFKHEDTRVYLVSSGDNLETFITKTPLKVENGIYTKIYQNEFQILLYLISFTLIFLVFITTFINDKDINWEISNNWQESLLCLVDIELEEGVYVYTALGRLIGKSKKNFTYRLFENYGIRGIRDIYLCPKYQTKTKKRSSKLSKLGI